MRRAVLLLLLCACKASTGDAVDSTAPTASAWLAPPADASAPPDERLATVNRWNEAMRAHDVAALTALYDERVFFYGLPMSRVAAMDRLDHLFRTTPDYTQTVSHASVEASDGGDAVRVAFTKRATANGHESSYEAYVVLHLVGSSYRILEESDTTTDASMTRWTEVRYPDECRRAIGAAIDELWAQRVGPVAFQQDMWFECQTPRHQCIWRYWLPPTPGGFAHRMITLDVDLVTGALRENGGWASNQDATLTMAPAVHARIVDACRGAKVLSSAE